VPNFRNREEGIVAKHTFDLSEWIELGRFKYGSYSSDTQLFFVDEYSNWIIVTHNEYSNRVYGDELAFTKMRTDGSGVTEEKRIVGEFSQIVGGKLYFSRRDDSDYRFGKHIYSVDIDFTSEPIILVPDNSYVDALNVTDKYIYYLNRFPPTFGQTREIIRSNLDGSNPVILAEIDSDIGFIHIYIAGDWIFLESNIEELYLMHIDGGELKNVEDILPK